MSMPETTRAMQRNKHGHKEKLHGASTVTVCTKVCVGRAHKELNINPFNGIKTGISRIVIISSCGSDRVIVIESWLMRPL